MCVCIVCGSGGGTGGHPAGVPVQSGPADAVQGPAEAAQPATQQHTGEREREREGFKDIVKICAKKGINQMMVIAVGDVADQGAVILDVCDSHHRHW